jgi:predicted metal-binding protein
MNDRISAALAVGFEYAAELDISTLVPRQDIREMCAEDKCHAYGKNWTCPPACGTLDECRKRIEACGSGLLVQTVQPLKNSLDWNGMMAAEKRHLERFHTLAAEFRSSCPETLCLGAGGCRICKTCAWPEPCRFPEKACSSLEAYGLFVTDVCRKNGLAYDYGEKRLAYTAAFLFPRAE